VEISDVELRTMRQPRHTLREDITIVTKDASELVRSVERNPGSQVRERLPKLTGACRSHTAPWRAA
jgi:hypothetical protein